MTDPTAAPQGEDDSPSIANVLALADRAGLWYPLQNDEQGIYGRARVAEFARSIWQAALAAERDRLTAEAAALREDAERYRDVRERIYVDNHMAILRIDGLALMRHAGETTAEQFDAAIDAARKEQT